MGQELRIYDFLGKLRIGIKADQKILDRCEENIEERSSGSTEHDGLILVNQQGKNQILKNENYPYLWKKSLGKKAQYYRYATLVREIVRLSKSDYEIFEYTPDNEGILNTFRNIYCQSEISNKNALIHASLLNINGGGIIILGPCRSGKTSLTLGLLREMRGNLVNDGISLVCHEENLLKGFYLPRQIYLRFSLILEDPLLHHLLTDYDLQESFQYLDHEALQRIIKARAFNIDAGITVSRKKIREMYGVDTLIQTRIDRIIFPEYSDNFKISNLGFDEALKRFRLNEFPLRSTFNFLGAQEDIKAPRISKIKDEWLEHIRFKSISFSQKHISIKTLEELLG